jgi:AraC-like DNA-binding protein
MEPVFGAIVDELVFPPGFESVPVRAFNSRLRDYFDVQCKQLAGKFEADAPVTARVREAIIGSMDGGDSSMGAIARRVGMSSRTLHRRLSGEGTRFDAIVDTVREEFAKRYLARSSVSATEIAYLIGFQSPPAFFRAFKRWTGRTPKEFLSTPPRA